MGKRGSSSTSEDRSDGMVLGALSTVAALAAAAGTRRAMRTTWKAVTGEEPPDDPASRETDWMVAVLWAVSSGAAIGVARMLVERQLVGRVADRRNAGH